MTNQGQDAGAQVQVSVQVLTFEIGLYRIAFEAGSSALAESSLGFPCARVELPFGTKPGTAAVAVQGDGGWLARTGDAALVQIALPRTRLLLTTYRLRGTSGMPTLHVQQLDVRQPQSTAPRPAGTIVAPASGAYQVQGFGHVQGRGDRPTTPDGWCGEPGSGCPIEGFSLAMANVPAGLRLEYQGVLGQDWLTPWAVDGEYSGSRGLALPLLGFAARLTGPHLERLNCSYVARFVDGSETGPLVAGEICVCPSGAPLEAFRLSITWRDAARAAETPDVLSVSRPDATAGGTVAQVPDSAETRQICAPATAASSGKPSGKAQGKPATAARVTVGVATPRVRAPAAKPVQGKPLAKSKITPAKAPPLKRQPRLPAAKPAGRSKGARRG